MSGTFHPVTRLTTLLGPKPNHPWGALLPQTLLWAFRRFCVERLVGGAAETPLTEQLWDDHLELIHKYAPKGLESVSADWFTPENIEYLHSSLDAYNRFFILCLGFIDDALETDDPDAQDMISEFLDDGIGRILRDWLEDDFRPFRIFPISYDEDDLYPEGKFMILIRALIQYSQDHPVLEGEGEEEFAELVEGSADIPAPAPAPAPPLKPSADIASAIAHRRRTLCRRPRDRSTRGKTRRLHPIL